MTAKLGDYKQLAKDAIWGVFIGGVIAGVIVLGVVLFLVWWLTRA